MEAGESESGESDIEQTQEAARQRGGAGGSGSSASTGDFYLSAYTPPSALGYLARGGFQEPDPACLIAWPAALDCPIDPGLIYPWIDGYGQTFYYRGQSLSVLGANGFDGPVTLEVLNLPPGVSSLIPATVNDISPYPKGIYGALLKASAGAQLGPATVTVRATSGAFVHTVDLTFVVADGENVPTCVDSICG